MKTYLLLPLLALPLLAGCGGTQVKRIDTAAVVDISGKWNDTDSRLTAEELIADCLSRPWISAASGPAGENPSVIVGTVRNDSSEHLNTGVFTEDLQRALINSGRVNFVASKAERGEVRDERLDQDTNASEETKKAHGQETGADFMLSGNISTIEDKEGGKSVILYQVNMKLLNMKTNQISWSGQKKIKKSVKRSGSSW
ncbi:MAG TPA: penicillin-binding protein activator LpoB [Elusimicrobiales bacterium]|nr:penicillin-binding protein activator LpoB [Elusimicrobiales bacterium]